MDPIDSEMMREAMGDALVQALPKALPTTAKQLVSDPEFWAAASQGMQQHASNRAGNWLMKTILFFVSRGLIFLVAGSVMYALGGWGLVAKLFSGGIK